MIESEQDIYSYLTLLSNDNFSFCIYIKEDSRIMQDEQFIHLIKNISKYAEINADLLMGLNGRCCITAENNETAFWEKVEQDRIKYEESNVEEPEIQIYVLNKYTNEIISTSKWYYLQDVALERK